MQADDSWEKKYCLLGLWHEPLDPRDDPKQHLPVGSTETDVMISEEGCLLPCKYDLLRHAWYLTSSLIVSV